MDPHEYLDPARLRAKAAEIVEAARRVSDKDIRAELFRLAEHFSRMAERLERRAK